MKNQEKNLHKWIIASFFIMVCMYVSPLISATPHGDNQMNLTWKTVLYDYDIPSGTLNTTRWNTNSPGSIAIVGSTIQMATLAGPIFFKSLIFPDANSITNITLPVTLYSDAIGSCTANLYLFGMLALSKFHNPSFAQIDVFIFRNATGLHYSVGGVYSGRINLTTDNTTIKFEAVADSGGQSQAWFYGASNFTIGNSSLNMIPITPLNDSFKLSTLNITFNASLFAYQNFLRNVTFFIDNQFNGTIFINGTRNITSISRNLSSLSLTDHNWYTLICDNLNQCTNSTIYTFNLKNYYSDIDLKDKYLNLIL